MRHITTVGLMLLIVGLAWHGVQRSLSIAQAPAKPAEAAPSTGFVDPEQILAQHQGYQAVLKKLQQKLLDTEVDLNQQLLKNAEELKAKVADAPDLNQQLQANEAAFAEKKRLAYIAFAKKREQYQRQMQFAIRKYSDLYGKQQNLNLIVRYSEQPIKQTHQALLNQGQTNYVVFATNDVTTELLKIIPAELDWEKIAAE